MKERQDDIFRIIGKLEGAFENIKNCRDTCVKKYEEAKIEITEVKKDLKQHTRTEHKLFNDRLKYLAIAAGLGILLGILGIIHSPEKLNIVKNIVGIIH